MRALQRLQDHGFIVQEMRGSFSRKLRHASEWRLTEFSSDISNRPATKEFAAWRKTKTGSLPSTGRVSWRNPSSPQVEQLRKGTDTYGSPTTPTSLERGAVRTPLLVCQGEGDLSNAVEVSERRRDADQTASAAALALHIAPRLQRMN
jgi:hypothetical protein